MKDKRLLVVSAHAADFVWRGGGTIAKYLKAGAEVKLIILSVGVRGESNDLWKIDGNTYDSIKERRIGEVETALGHIGFKGLGQDVEFWDWEDYHMDFGKERMAKMVRTIRDFAPTDILSHGPGDAFNPDHENVSRFVFESNVLAISAGVRLEGTNSVKQARIFGFEPHQTEVSGFEPHIIIDITDTYEQKEKAMEVFLAQPHLIQYYKDRAQMRGNHARRCSGNQQYRQAESFTRRFPCVSGEFV